MKFGNPGWLWAIPAVLALGAALLWSIRRKQALFSAFAEKSVWESIAPERDERAAFRKAWFWVIATLFLVVSAARPQWGTREEMIKVSGLDIVVALDLSNSMEVEDVAPSRLRKAKHLVSSLIKRLEGDRVGIVGFAGSTFVASPLTTDLGYVSETLEILNPKMVVNQGTDIGLAIETASKALDRGSEEGNSSGGVPSVSKALILITDGEDQEGAAAEAAKGLSKKGIRLYVIGVGSDTGGPIPVRDPEGVLRGYKRDAAGKSVISALQPETLKRAAEAGGGKFWSASPGEAEIDEILQDLGALSRGDFVEKRRLIHQERFQYPLALALALFIFEISLAARRLSGASSALIFLGLMISLSGKPANAGLRSYIENERALKALEKGRIEEAKSRFGKAQALDPTSPELRFNQGFIELKEGQAEKAVDGFEGAARAAKKRGDSALGARSLFNLGGALAQKGETDKAIRSWLAAIDAARMAGDTELERDAKKNIQVLAEQQRKKKEEEQKQDQDQQQKQNQQQQNQNNDQDEKKKQEQSQGNQKSKDPHQEGDQTKQNRPQRKQKFQSPKLSKEDAERVMSELSNREKELQQRLKKQKGNAQGQQKDW